jgi:CubicO group peptidase (beta-lactamase class C family)
MKFKACKIGRFFLFFLIVTNVSAQSLPDSITKRIDSLFIKWNTTYSPGCAIGIVRNDSLIYTKGYGMANLEYAIPNTPATIFHMGSISKQFTAWSILLLERHGKLHLDDDIHKYLSWFPYLKEKITIRNLLNHTSGIREHLKLLAISGTNVVVGDVITQEQIVKILSKQQALNFKPGEKYSYSNSGYVMLAEIATSVSGLSLRKFTDSAIFKPLGMSNTHFHDDYTEIEKNRANCYDRVDSNHFKNSISSNSYVGSLGLFTNINEMSKWVMNFYEHKTGDQQVIDSLTKKGKLNSGRELTYASGIEVDAYRGWRQYSHEGVDAGLRTYVSVFPDLKMGFIVFSNLGDFDPVDLAHKMAEFFIKDTTQKKGSAGAVKTDSTTAIVKDRSSLKKFFGHYVGEDGLPVSFDFKNSKLYYHLYGDSGILVKESKDSFAIMNYSAVKFVFSIKAKDTMVDIIAPGLFYNIKK